jgi:ribosome assembly protein SQT1
MDHQEHEREHELDQVEETDEAYLEEDDVLAELPEDGDHPMDEEDGVDIAHGEGFGEGEEIVWEDSSIQHFPTHRSSVFVVSTHPTLPIAVSGGEDDLGYLWNIEDGEELVKLTGHADSVTCAGFSADGSMVATGGMDGKIRIWRKVAKSEKIGDWEFLTELQGPDEVVVSLGSIHPSMVDKYSDYGDGYLVAKMAS